MITNILVLCGPTGSGKTFIAEMLSANDMGDYIVSSNPPVFHKPMQVTTRKQRDIEDCDSYLFLKSTDDYKSLNMDSKLTAKTYFNDNYYGTLMSNMIHGKNAWNVIVASTEGAADVINTFRNDSECNIKTAIILAEGDDGMINEHCRDIQFFKNELFDLLQSPYDYYIPNYMDSRATLGDVLTRLGYDVKKGLWKEK